MIGFYDYTVVLTLLSLASSVFGMTQAMDAHFRAAIFCLALSGLCDTFDGKIARSKKNRTDDEKLYGIQLDSLCDIVCFGVFPTMICYFLGVNSKIGVLSIIYYCICGVIRLAFFNVLETNRQTGKNNEEKVYHGLPITSISVILPMTFLLSLLVPEKTFSVILTAMLLLVGTCFIIDFKMKRPKDAVIWLLIVLLAVAVVLIFFFAHFRIYREPVRSGPLIDDFIRWFDEKCRS